MVRLAVTRFLVASAFFSAPSLAQFGVAGGRRKKTEATAFENLQEMAKQQQDKAAVGAAPGGNMMDLMKGFDMETLSQQLEEMMKDPAMADQMNAMNAQMMQAYEKLSKMSQEEVQQELAQAFDVLSSGDMIEQMVQNRMEVIQQLETANMIPAQDIARMKTDPEFFEMQMRESFESMKSMLSDPETVKGMSQVMSTMAELMGNSEELMTELTNMLESGDLQNDDKIEEARLQILSGEFAAKNPLLAEMFESAEMQELLKDPVTWRDSVKEGQKNLGQAAGQLKDEL